eukprot:m.14636 g.14636  ORF g.14636 m.14636 type:complete len:554 (+) comp6381_c0_seq2:115-1776(+)
MAAKPLKLLVVGDVDGKVKQLYKRVKKVNASNGPFDAVLCCGSFFGRDGSVDDEWLTYTAGKATVPVPTYICGPVTAAQVKHYPLSPSGGDLCTNVTFLGSASVSTLIGGLKIAVLSGTHDLSSFSSEAPDDQLNPFYTSGNVQKLIDIASTKSFKGVDVLLTSTWPDGVTQFNAQRPELPPPQQSPGARAVAAALKPRYHFAGGHAYFMRAPYRNHEEGQMPTHASRFIGVGAVGNPHKDKWLYAFNLTPMASEASATLLEQPADTTRSPYSFTGRRQQHQQPGGQAGRMPMPPRSQGPPRQLPAGQQVGLFWGANPQQMGKRRHQSGGQTSKRPLVTPDSCWFCLGSPKVEKHLVASVGTQLYLALPKGTITSGHILIVPIQHVKSTIELDEAGKKEVTRYKQALRSMFEEQGKTVVMFERNFRSDHLQLQVVPVPAEMKTPDLVKAINQTAKRHHITFDYQPKGTDLGELFDEGVPFFSVELPSGDIMVTGITTRSFPLQFGREMLCQPDVLNCLDRVDWKACALDKEGETEQAKAFKTQFRSFDPTLKS